MTRARDIANLVDSNGDIVAGALDNVPASNDASALTTGTLASARLPSSGVDASSITVGTIPNGRFPATLPAISGANLTNIPAGADVLNLENEVGLLNFNRLIDNSGAIDSFVKGFSDAFVDETGVNTGANVNATYRATPNTYAMSQVVTSNTQIGANSSLWQSNTSNWTFGFNNSNGNAYGLESSEGSLGGNARTTIRSVAAYDITGDFLELRINNTSGISGGIGIVDQNYASHIPGNTTANHWGAGIFSSSSSHWVNGSPITAGVKASMLWFSGANAYAYNITGNASSAVAYTAGSSGTVFTLGLDPSTRRLYVKVNGTLNTTLNNHWASGTNNKTIDDDYYIIAHSPAEGNNIDFDYLDLSQSFGTAGVSTLQTTAQTATSQPDTVRLVLIGKEDDTQTINTDTVWSISRDNATTFSNITMTESGNYNSSGVKIYTGTVDVSGQPSGSSIVLKQTTSANKGFTLHGYSLLYK
jgi:hypothetical protein